jgi:two-component sensor histidine kinase
MEELLHLLPGPQPLWVRYTLTVLVVIATFGLRLTLGDYGGPYFSILYIPAIVGAALLFDRGSGFLAILLSILLSASLLDWSGPHNSDHLLALLIFGLISSGLVLVAEGFHKALARAHAYGREKDLLLEELSHRVKNKFAIISSVIAMQARGAAPETEEALNAVAHRVRVLSDLHNYLQMSRGDGEVRMDEYLGGLCNDLMEAVKTIRPISHLMMVEPIALDMRTALAIGLIVNELVTNAIKHAFPNDRVGVIRVELKRKDQGIVLIVSDDGIGCKAAAGSNLGTRLTTLLAGQLGGEIRRSDASPGCCVTVDFSHKVLGRF